MLMMRRKTAKAKLAMEDAVMGKKTLQHPLKDTSNRFTLLDPDDEKDEMMDRGKSAIEEEHMPGDGKNASDRGENFVAVGSGKLAMDQAEFSPETEESVKEDTETDEAATRLSEDTESEEAATQRALLASSGKLAKKWRKKQKKKKAKVEAEAEAKARDVEAGKAEVSVSEPGRPEESMTKAAKAVMKEAEEGALLVGLNSTGGESSMLKDSEEESGKRSEMVGMRSEMQRHAEEPTAPLPSFYIRLPPEYQETLMKRNAVREAMSKYCRFGDKKLSESSKNSAGGGVRKEAETELEKRLEMMRISPERQLYGEIQRALLYLQEKLDKKKSRKMDQETLRLLNDMANMLDQGGDDDEKDEMDDGGKSATPLTKKTATEEEMAQEEESFNSHRRLWEYKWSKTCGSFEDITVLSSMQFTHYTPGRRPYCGDCSTLETVQIFSIKLTGLAGGLELPLSVYGVVAVRDKVDRNRNILFFRDRSEAQEVKQNDPFLHLIGPSRAVVLNDKVCIEIKLRVKGGSYSQDKALISCVRGYVGWNDPGVSTICFKNVLCTLEMCLQPVKRTVQATILGVQVAAADGSWPFEYGGLVACTPLSGTFVVSGSGVTRRISPSSSQIVLIESKDEAIPKGEDGHVHLWRQVVSVKLEGRLDVLVQAYSKSGAITEETCVLFYPNVCNISQKKCYLGDAEVTVTVAWSVMVGSKIGLSLELSGMRSA